MIASEEWTGGLAALLALTGTIVQVEVIGKERARLLMVAAGTLRCASNLADRDDDETEEIAVELDTSSIVILARPEFVAADITDGLLTFEMTDVAVVFCPCTAR